MNTKPTASLLLLPFAVLIAIAPQGMADAPDTADPPSVAPKGRPLSNYSHLDVKSPFEFEPVKPQDAAVTDPFEGVSLAGYCGSGNKLTVYLITGTKEKKRVTVYGDGSPLKARDESGYRVIGIKRGKTLKKTWVILEKDGVQKDVGFDEDTLKPKATGNPGGQQQNVQLVPGPDGKMVPRPVIPRPSGSNPAPQQYQAPQAFIPGHGNAAPQAQPGQPGVAPNPGLPQGAMSNQQLMNQLVGPNGQPGGAAPGAQPGVVIPGGEQPRQSTPPSRRRVVLPTTQQ